MMIDGTINDHYNDLRGFQGLKKKILPGLYAFFTIITSPFVFGIVAAFAAVLTIPFLIALWAKPKWLAQKMKQPEVAFDSTSNRLRFTALGLFSAVILPFATLYQMLVHELPKKFKQQSVDGLTRTEKTTLFVNVMTLAALLLVTFPPAGIAVAIVACGKAASGMHLTSIGASGSTLFVMFTQLGSLLVSLITGKVADCIEKQNCCKPLPAEQASEMSSSVNTIGLQNRTSAAAIMSQLPPTMLHSQTVAQPVVSVSQSESRVVMASNVTVLSMFQPASSLGSLTDAPPAQRAVSLSHAKK